MTTKNKVFKEAILSFKAKACFQQWPVSLENDATQKTTVMQEKGKVLLGETKQEGRLGSGTTHPQPNRRAGRPPGREPPRPGPSTGEATVWPLPPGPSQCEIWKKQWRKKIKQRMCYFQRREGFLKFRQKKRKLWERVIENKRRLSHNEELRRSHPKHKREMKTWRKYCNK